MYAANSSILYSKEKIVCLSGHLTSILSDKVCSKLLMLVWQNKQINE